MAEISGFLRVRQGGFWCATTPLKNTTPPFKESNCTAMAFKVTVDMCSEKDGKSWWIDRVGPFITYGGWDLTAVNRPLFFESATPMQLFGISASPVNAIGEQLAFPPLHIHHSEYIHVFLDSDGAIDGGEIFDVSGDSQCPAVKGVDVLGSVRCHQTLYGDYYKLITERITHYLHVNDVRPRQANPLYWWFETRMLLKEGMGLPQKRLSSFITETIQAVQPAPYRTFLVVGGNEDSFFYFAGRWPRDGWLSTEFTWLHTHSVVLQDSYVISGHPSALGLGRGKTSLRVACKSEMTRRTKYGTNSLLKESLNFGCNDERTICCAKGNVAVINGTAYDRRSIIHCRHAQLRRGHPFTVVAFAGSSPITQDLILPSPFALHVEWYLHYIADADTNRSYFGGVEDLSDDEDGTGAPCDPNECRSCREYMPLADFSESAGRFQMRMLYPTFAVPAFLWGVLYASRVYTTVSKML